MNERFESIEAFRAADERRRSAEVRLGFWPKIGDGGAEARFVHATNEVYVRFADSGEVELLGQVASVELADALLRLPASSIAELPWLRHRIAGAPVSEGEIEAALADHRRVWASYDRSRDRRDT